MMESMTNFNLFFEKETSFFIINKLKVQESYTMRIIEKPRNGGERESTRELYNH